MDRTEEIPVATVDPKLGPTELLHEMPTGAGLGTAGSLVDRRFVTAALMLVMVLASMEQTVTSTAMPTIIGKLKGIEHYSWVASIYLLACTISMPIYGRLADTLGRRIVILCAIGVFATGSLLASSAQTMTQLIIFRGIQGLGAGGIMPVVLTILGDIYTLEERARVQGLFSAVWGTSSLAGPALGALLVRTLGWRSIFYVNLPFGLLGMIALIWKYRDRGDKHSTDIDLPGAISLGLLCMSLLLLVGDVAPAGAGFWWPLSLGLAAAIAGIYFVRHERRTANPILPPNFLTHPVIGTSLMGSMLMGICFLSLDTFVPLYVQGGRGGGAIGSASVVTPVMLTWALSGIVAAPMVVHLGFRRTATFGTLMITTGFTGLLLAAIFSFSPWMLTAVLAITGFGFGPTSMSYLLSAQETVEWKQRGLVTSNVMFMRTAGGALGIGALGGLFTSLISSNLAATPQQLLDPSLRKQIPQHMLAAS
ncbi:MAG TPA: MFS transporter, partial [Tepidisphaeraceae bacterium]|nr:MFS transporter [Tepidisphaeraceae bacterium]